MAGLLFHRLLPRPTRHAARATLPFMAGLLFRRLLPLFALLLSCTCLATKGHCCPFCSMQGETLTALVNQSATPGAARFQNYLKQLGGGRSRRKEQGRL